MWIYWPDGAAWQVGYFDPSSGYDRNAVEAYDDAEDAREAVHFLNGGAAVEVTAVVRALDEIRERL